LYHPLAYINSSLYDAITAGDYGNFLVNAGAFNPVQAVHAKTLVDQFNNQWDRGGEVGSIVGEQENDTYDVNERRASLASPTAIAAQLNDTQPVLFGGPMQKVTKLIAMVPGS